MYRIAKNLLKRFWFKKMFKLLTTQRFKTWHQSIMNHAQWDSFAKFHTCKKVFNSGWNMFKKIVTKGLVNLTLLVHRGVFAPLLSPFNKIDGIQTFLPLLFSALHKPNKNDFRRQISSTIYARIFRTNAYWAAFLCLEFGFKLTFVQKSARNMLMKLTPVFRWSKILVMLLFFINANYGSKFKQRNRLLS